MEREVSKWVIGVVVVVVLAAPAVWAVSEFRSSLENYADDTSNEGAARAEWVLYDAATEQNERSIEGCQANNVLRRELHGFLLDAEAARDSEGDHGVAANYAARAKALVEAVRGADPKREGSPERDCRAAYPPPRKPDVPRPEAE